ncbi:Imm50 family immunity protein [Streptomyces sp. NPDC058733]|uniref:Imm50 family immunity protein n=1 Tax=Streptomyces sp. NPDC058733 TaxID=3346614 RepID=UPI0036762EA5
MGGDWLRLIPFPGPLREAYAAAPPRWEACRLTYLHLDERGTSVTVGLDTTDLPAVPPAAWHGEAFNAVQFFLRFDEVRQLRATGWTLSPHTPLTLAAGRDGMLEVSLGEGPFPFTFHAPTARVTTVRPYLAACSP